MTSTTRRELIGGDVIEVVNQDSDETFGATTNDIEIEIDEDEASQELSTQRRVVRRRTFNEANLNVDSVLTPDLETLSEAGVIDDSDNGKIVFGADDRTWEDGALLRVYNDVDDIANVGSAEPEQVVLCEDVEWSFSGIDYSDDFPTVTLEGAIHGDVYLDYDESE